MGLDLDAILAIADGYAEKMKLARDYFDRREPVPEKYKQYLATLDDAEAVKAFEALRPLVERVRVLERTLEILEGYDLAVCSCWDCPAREYCKGLDKPCFSIVLDHTKKEAENGL